MYRKSLSLPRQLAVLSGILFGLTLSSSAQAVWGHAPVGITGPRINGPVDPHALTTLKGNTLAVANPSNDRGRVPDETPTGRLLLQLKPSPDQQSALDALVRAQQDPKSPSYHKWLTTAQYAQQFGAADADIQTVSGYLSQQGFTVTRVLPNKLAIEFSGTTGQLSDVFKTEIHSFSSKGQTFFANDRDPQIPAALSPVIAGFVSLNNYSAVAGSARANVTTQKIIGKRGGAHAMYTDQTAVAVNVAPQDIAAIYDIPGSATGTGVTIGLAGNSNVNLTYVENYRTTFGLGAKTPVVIIDGDDPGITSDNDIDVAQLELLTAVAPSASINYYTSASTDLGSGVNYALIRAVDDDAVQVLLLSQESCEANLGTTFNAFINAIGEQASALGISVISPAGDGGSAACDSDRGYGNTYHQTANLGLSVNGYASSPFVTAVGATDFYYPPAERTEAGVLTCCWNVNNGGTSGYESALGYIQEQPWNDSNTANNGLPSAVLLATGGGVSTLGASNSDLTVSSPYLEPAWQLPVVPTSLSSSGTVPARVVPDVSIFGGDGENGSAYMVCLQADECVNGSPDTLVYEQAGGSATAAATFAGVAALVVQSHGAQGNINPTLYSMYSTVPSAFHDVVNGTNTVQCTTGSPNCGSGGFLVDGSGALAYSATTGYDAASGLGSVDVAKLISGWAPPNTSATATSLTLTTVGTSTPITTFTHGTYVQANINVTSASGTPTGDVSVIAGTPAPSSAGVNFFTLTNGSAVATQGVSGLPGGTYKLTARYAGDDTYAASLSSPITVTVTPEASKVVTASTSFTPGSSLSYGTPITVQVYVYSLNNQNSIGTPTGSVTVTDLGNTLTVVPVDAQGNATFTTILPAGAHLLGFNYGGDASYQASSLGSDIAVSVNSGVTGTVLNASASNDGKGDYVQLVAVVNTSLLEGGSVDWPTGSITFQTVGTGAKTLGTSVLVPGNNQSGRIAGIANFQLPGSKLPTNPAKIVATYVPAASSNFAASLSNVLSLTTQSAATLNTSTTTLATSDGKSSYFDYDGSITLNVTVTGGGAQPTGTVSLFSNGQALGTVTLSGDSGSYTIAQNSFTGVLPLLVGRNVITAQYNGDSTHATSTRELSLTILDEAVLPDFSLQSNATFGTITANSSTAAFTLQLTSINNFAGLGQKVTFTAAVPTGIACTFGSKTVTFTTTATYATDTISCGAANGYTIASLEPASKPLKGFWIASGGAALASILLLGVPARRKSWQKLMASLAVILCIGLTAFATAGLSGCGGNANIVGHSIPAHGESSDVKPAATPQAGKTLLPGTYQVLVTATGPFATNVQSNTATTQTHTLPLQIVVQ